MIVHIEYFARLYGNALLPSEWTMTKYTYCQIISDLQAPVDPESDGTRTYYVLEAITKHELKHIAEFKQQFESQFSRLVSDLKTKLSIPLSPAQNAASAAASMRNNPQYSATVEQWVEDVKTAWKNMGEGNARAAEREVLDATIARIRSYAQENMPWYNEVSRDCR